MSPDIPASIKARLLNRARAAQMEFQLYLVRYAGERFLCRLGASEYRERCVLKGAGLLTLWLPDPYRTTRDLDFLAAGASDERSISEMVSAICAVPYPEDGLTFEPILFEKGLRGRLDENLVGVVVLPERDLDFGGIPDPPSADHSELEAKRWSRCPCSVPVPGRVPRSQPTEAVA